MTPLLRRAAARFAARTAASFVDVDRTTQAQWAARAARLADQAERPAPVSVLVVGERETA